ncbi:hypothetical protein [Lonsdalea britannica]|uniref:hypothetical protein n=1 Tax=Lonsdalea britannica TaxID=1082704 RepID=UPI0013C2A96D|nr:hypothetical protein [Lonsdalea britannica]
MAVIIEDWFVDDGRVINVENLIQHGEVKSGVAWRVKRSGMAAASRHINQI